MLLESESLILELWFSTYYMTLNKLLFPSKSYPMYKIGTISVCAHQDFCLSSSFSILPLDVIHGHLTLANSSRNGVCHSGVEVLKS